MGEVFQLQTGLETLHQHGRIHAEILFLITKQTPVFAVGVLNDDIQGQMNEIFAKICEFSSNFDELLKGVDDHKVYQAR